jgi:formylglycine-generating enzyme required for sulfatase activity
VTWIEAMAYCKWLTSKCFEEEDDRLMHNEIIRLPTTDEWSAVAEQLSSAYVWGDNPQGVGAAATINWSQTGIGSASTVGLFPPQGELYDFAGNVFEWANECTSAFSADVLGGSYLTVESELNSLEPGHEHILSVSPELGFRWIVAREA